MPEDIIINNDDYVKMITIINDAIKYAGKYNVDTAVFRNYNGTYLDRIYSLARDPNGEFDIRFVAIARLCKSRRLNNA